VIDFESKYITFDMHGMLLRWPMTDMTRDLLADIVRDSRRKALEKLRPALSQGGQPGPPDWVSFIGSDLDGSSNVRKRVLRDPGIMVRPGVERQSTAVMSMHQWVAQ
jgi:hypothetical protein